ncbi:hypothetical protein QP162_12350 [Sphingomonas aurantiaca]|uniref:Uncharacterized protein n=1 Tax=Sphingomonas aurantiaca TaxID=185949 RepID=A0A2T5GPS3_9SPHN|nr:hypothetical protein [Sphingomonas aurantiaca]PTQ61329.1 hypothetical protein C8J26_1658 [Sphingomonas aurantiaca]
MKFFTIAAAGLVALTGLAPVGIAAEASAQRTVVHERTVVRHSDRRPGYGRHAVRTRQVCRNVVRNHHRQRVCRTVRVNRSR